jgi:hypothetical protein
VALLSHLFGLDDASGAWYLWWSGFFADVSIFGSLGALYKHHMCHVHRCWRVGRVGVPGTHWVVCWRHHPDNAPTAQQVKEG